MGLTEDLVQRGFRAIYALDRSAPSSYRLGATIFVPESGAGSSFSFVGRGVWPILQWPPRSAWLTRALPADVRKTIHWFAQRGELTIEAGVLRYRTATGDLSQVETLGWLVSKLSHADPPTPRQLCLRVHDASEPVAERVDLVVLLREECADDPAVRDLERWLRDGAPVVLRFYCVPSAMSVVDLRAVIGVDTLSAEQRTEALIALHHASAADAAEMAPELAKVITLSVARLIAAGVDAPWLAPLTRIAELATCSAREAIVVIESLATIRFAGVEDALLDRLARAESSLVEPLCAALAQVGTAKAYARLAHLERGSIGQKARTAKAAMARIAEREGVSEGALSLMGEAGALSVKKP